jgi:hypothetical protein
VISCVGYRLRLLNCGVEQVVARGGKGSEGGRERGMWFMTLSQAKIPDRTRERTEPPEKRSPTLPPLPVLL